MAKYAETEPAAVAAYNRLACHSWYLDPSTIVFALANSDEQLPVDQKAKMASKLLPFSRLRAAQTMRWIASWTSSMMTM